MWPPMMVSMWVSNLPSRAAPGLDIPGCITLPAWHNVSLTHDCSILGNVLPESIWIPYFYPYILLLQSRGNFSWFWSWPGFSIYMNLHEQCESTIFSQLNIFVENKSVSFIIFAAKLACHRTPPMLYQPALSWLPDMKLWNPISQSWLGTWLSDICDCFVSPLRYSF